MIEVPMVWQAVWAGWQSLLISVAAYADTLPEPAPALAAAVVMEQERLQVGTALTDLAGGHGSARMWAVDVTADLMCLEIRLQDGTGDADLYLRYGEPPDLQAFDYRPFVVGNDERIHVEQPRAGTWYLMVHGAEAYEGARMSLRCRMGGEAHAGREPIEERDLELTLYYELSGLPMDAESWSGELRNRLLREQGRAAYNRGDYAGAVEAWARWEEQDRTDPDPIALQGDVHLRAGNLESAIAEYFRSLELQPSQIGLMTRLARLLDVEAGRPEEARILLNRYSRLFPNHPAVPLAQSEWLIRRKRYEEAIGLIRTVIETEPSNLRARALLHGLLSTPQERYDNLLAMRAVGQQPGNEMEFAAAVGENHLLTRPESWVLMDFLERMAFEAPDELQRNAYLRFLPREQVADEDFRLGQLSRSWISSMEEQWNEEGHLVLTADPSQTEAYLRLERSDAMHNGFIEAQIESTRGYFWIYARRGEGNMIRFGFDETGTMYQQIWMNGQLLVNHSRLWARPAGTATLRLQVQSDGVFASVDGRPAFSAPIAIPPDMGLGWWGVAPWAPQPGLAAVELNRVSGGPLPVVLGLVQPRGPGGRSERELAELHALVRSVSSVAPRWYLVGPEGRVLRQPGSEDSELRLLSRYYRARIMPVLSGGAPETLDWEQAFAVARAERLDGFTLLVRKMPDPVWVQRMEERLITQGVSLHLVLLEPGGRRAQVRELCPLVSLFPGPRHPRLLPLAGPAAPGAPLSIDRDSLLLF